MAKPTQVNTDFIPMATGAVGRNLRSAGNIMPGANAEGSAGGRTPPSGSTGGTMGIPSRVGGPPSAGAKGGYMNQPGSPSQNTHAVTPGSVPKSTLGGASKAALTHGRTLGAIAHLKSLGFSHPDLDVHHGNATKALTGMTASKMSKKTTTTGGFGSIGGGPSTGQNNGMPSPAGFMPKTIDADDGI